MRGLEEVVVDHLGLTIEEAIFLGDKFAFFFDKPGLFENEVLLLVDEGFLIGDKGGMGVEDGFGWRLVDLRGKVLEIVAVIVVIGVMAV